MKQFDIQVISQELIKPSSSTPDHLRRHNLSFIDQTQPPFYIPFIMFYPKQNDHQINQSQIIKKSLSQALTIFYPLAGRIKESTFVDCSDEGALFVEAKANCELSYLLHDPSPEDHNRFFPLPLDSAHTLPLAVQLTFFRCGGCALFFGMSHKVGDGGVFFKFINAWAAISRGETNSERPRFDLANLFPPRTDLPDHSSRTGIKKENVVSKRFVFNATALAAIKDKCTDENSKTSPPSRMVALSAFLWSRFVRSRETQEDDDRRKLYVLLHAVDFFPRLSPPILDFHFGNSSEPVLTMQTGDRNEPYSSVAKMVTEAIKTVDNEYVKRLQESGGELGAMEEDVEVVTFGITSWCRFPIYEADFGWGKPAWVASVLLPYKNVVILLDTESGDGIEAWVNLKEEDMAKFKSDEELLSFAS